MQRIAVVTGANQGIGKAIASALSHSGDFHTIMTARRQEDGEKALEEVLRGGGNNVTLFCPFEITKSSDACALQKHIEEKHGGELDVLINNAGFAFKGSTFGEDEARITVAVNFLGTANVIEGLLPCLRKAARKRGQARIINVCSQAGKLAQVSPALQARFQDPHATKADIQMLVEEFFDNIRQGTVDGSGWPHSMYGVSKLAEIAYTFALARDLEKEAIIVNAVCPGYCATSMSTFKGPRTPEQGAETPVWLACRAGQVNDLTGGFYYDKQLISW